MLRHGLWTTLLAATLVSVACSKSDNALATASPDAATSSSGGTSSSSSSGSPEAPTDGGSSSGSSGGAGDAAPDAPAPGTFTLTSTAFTEGGTIPATHALCPNGSGNQSPPLEWTNAPAGTQSYAIVMRDPDVAPPDNYHWVLWDIPATTTSLPAGISAVANPPTPAGAKQTYWSFGDTYSYQGPCPPQEHSYQFTVYSFSVPTLPIAPGEKSPKAADAVIQANKTGSASLTGKYAQ